jgi:hypothetical protein
LGWKLSTGSSAVNRFGGSTPASSPYWRSNQSRSTPALTRTTRSSSVRRLRAGMGSSADQDLSIESSPARGAAGIRR